MRHRERHQAPAIERIDQRDLRQATEPQSRLHRTLDGLGMLQLQLDIQIGQQPMHSPVKVLPRARALLTDNPRCIKQVVIR